MISQQPGKWVSHCDRPLTGLDRAASWVGLWDPTKLENTAPGTSWQATFDPNTFDSPTAFLLRILHRQRSLQLRMYRNPSQIADPVVPSQPYISRFLRGRSFRSSSVTRSTNTPTGLQVVGPTPFHHPPARNISPRPLRQRCTLTTHLVAKQPVDPRQIKPHAQIKISHSRPPLSPLPSPCPPSSSAPEESTLAPMAP